MNPARSTAAALFANNGADGSGRQLWLFWVAPLVGAALAALFYRAFAFGEPEEADELDDEDDEDDDDVEVVEETELVAVRATPRPRPRRRPAEAAKAEPEAEKKADDKA